MVHVKYIRKRGKLHGPYYYESYREGGKVKKRYLGTELPRENKVTPHFNHVAIVLVSLLILIVSIYFFLNILLIIYAGIPEAMGPCAYIISKSFEYL